MAGFLSSVGIRVVNIGFIVFLLKTIRSEKTQVLNDE